MSKREFFGLKIYKATGPLDNNVKHICTREQPHVYSHLCFITHLHKVEVDALLEEINSALGGGGFESNFVTDGTESTSVVIAPPNITIGQVCTISLTDMKGLLQEWKAFINS